MSARSKARKRALDILFEAEQRGINAETLLEQRIEKPATEHALNQYSVEIVRGVVARWIPINELLASYSQGWTIERM
ncbi:MAG: transcription antitermination factor NusB, partial [Dermatophilaceae bacterium]